MRWRLGSKGTPDSVIVFQDGKILVGSRSKFDPSTKDRLDKELNDAIQLINGTNKLPNAARLEALSLIQYYSQDRPVDAESCNLPVISSINVEIIPILCNIMINQ